jgi:hypothetical protein
MLSKENTDREAALNLAHEAGFVVGIIAGSQDCYIWSAAKFERFLVLCRKEVWATVTQQAAASASIPEGWQLVPKEPTQEMLDAFYEDESSVDTAKHRYKQLLSAAPAPPSAPANPKADPTGVGAFADPAITYWKAEE